MGAITAIRKSDRDQSGSGWEELVLLEILTARLQQKSTVTRETNMETGTIAGGLRQGWSVEEDQKRVWKDLSAPCVGADDNVEGSSCLVSQPVLECTVTRRTLVLSPRNEDRKCPRGYSMEQLSHVDETETIPHLDGLRLFTESSVVSPPISSDAAGRERETVLKLYGKWQKDHWRGLSPPEVQLFGIFSHLAETNLHAATHRCLSIRKHTFTSLQYRVIKWRASSGPGRTSLPSYIVFIIF